VKRNRRTRSEIAADAEGSGVAWNAYTVAYQRRYGVAPVRNAKVNGQLTHLARRIPIADLVATVEHYVRSQNARYLAAGHSVGCLLQDAEKLCTEARTGRMGTAHAARAEDKREGRAQEYEEVFERLRREDEAEAAALQAKGGPNGST
jgi:hypothetical protein